MTTATDSFSQGLLRSAFALMSLLCVLNATTTALAQTYSGSDARSETILYNPHSGIQLLQGFRFQFTNSDHHLRHIGVVPGDYPNTQELTLAYEDSNGDDPYDYSVQFRDQSPSGVYTAVVSAQNCLGSCAIAATKPSNDMVFVLRGFNISYGGGDDNHLKQLRIEERSGSINVGFGDAEASSSSDYFNVTVSYAYLHPSLLRSSGYVGGRGPGSQASPIDAGIAVLRGFSVAYVSDDHHVDQLGIELADGNATAFLNDENNDDQFDWSVDWSVLN
jgi:hypothetical protein